MINQSPQRKGRIEKAEWFSNHYRPVRNLSVKEDELSLTRVLKPRISNYE